MQLGQLTALSLTQRADWLVQNHGPVLRAALARTGAQGLPEGWGSEADFAWALAYNLAPAPDAPKPQHERKVLGHRTVDGQFGPETSLALLWEGWLRPRERGQTTWLAELAWSLACECRADWRPPKASVSPERSFNALLQRCHAPVVSFLRSRYGRALSAERLESCIASAWGQVYHAHWASKAVHRFLGLVTIRAYVTAVAVRRVQEELRQSASNREEDSLEGGRPSPVSLGGDLGPPGALGRFFRWHHRELDLSVSIRELPPRLALSSHCYHDSGLSKKLIAEAFRCSRDRISEDLLRGWDQLAHSPRLRQALNEIAGRG